MKRHQEAPHPEAASLPAWLAWQADKQPQAIALRHKRLGIWQQWRWAALQQQVAALAAGLAARGFADGHSLVLLSHPRPEVLLLSLAAQWLGGEAVALDPQQPARDLQAILLHVQPRWLLVEDADVLQSLPPTLPAAELLALRRRARPAAKGRCGRAGCLTVAARGQRLACAHIARQQ